MLSETLVGDVIDKIFVFDRTKSINGQKCYLMVRAGEEVYVKAYAGTTKYCKLRVVFDEFAVSSQFLWGTFHKPMESRCDGVYKLPHVIYEEWEDDKEELDDPKEYIVLCLKSGTIIPPSTLEELGKQLESRLY